MFELITLPNTYYQQSGEKLYNLNAQGPLTHPGQDQFMANVGQLNQNLVNLPGLQNQAIYSIPPPHAHYINQLPPPQPQTASVQNLSSASILAALQATANNHAAGSSSSSSSSSTSSASNAQICTGSSSTSSTSSSNPFVNNASSINSSASSSPSANQQQANLIPVNQQSQFGQLTYLNQQSQMSGSTQNLTLVNGEMEKSDPVSVILELRFVTEKAKLK